MTKLSLRDRLYDTTSFGGDIFVVGHPGLLLRSRDGGKTFENVQGGQTDEALFSVAFNSKGQGAVVGRSGVVLTTLDRGNTWQKTFVKLDEEHPSLFGVDVLDDGTIVAVGDFGAIVRSEDHGKTWARSSYTVKPDGPAASSVASDAAPAKSKSRRSRKKKGRASADEEASPTPQAAPAADPSCILVGTAESENEDVVQEARLTDVRFVDDKVGFIVAEFGLVLRSQDGGRTFQRQRSCTDKTLYSVSVISPTRAVAVGAEGTVIETTNGGSVWALRPSSTPEHLFGVWADDKRALVVGAAGTALSRTGEAAFQPVTTNVHGWLTSAWFDDKGQGVIVGGRAYLRRTPDGGNTQQRVFGE